MIAFHATPTGGVGQPLRPSRSAPVTPCGNDHRNPEKAGDCGCADWAAEQAEANDPHDAWCEQWRSGTCQCAGRAAHRAAMEAHPDCERCAAGVGTINPGPPHSAPVPPGSQPHRPHCTCDLCW